MSAKLLSVLVLLQVFSVASATTQGCDIHCDNLPLVPPRWGHNGKEVANVALKCVVQEECHLDINDILRNETSHDVDDPDHIFISVDLHFSCVGGASLGKLQRRLIHLLLAQYSAKFVIGRLTEPSPRIHCK